MDGKQIRDAMRLDSICAMNVNRRVCASCRAGIGWGTRGQAATYVRREEKHKSIFLLFKNAGAQGNR